MELYAATSYELAERLTKRYSTSFSLSSRLFDRSIRRHIYAIYGLVRIADEIVDAYHGDDAAEQLEQLQAETMRAIRTGYSTNPIVHAYALTAKEFGIGSELIDPFFASMATDLDEVSFTQADYERYIYGSAEVVGLMCLKVFVGGDEARYNELEAGACALGSAYQKVNFLRDIKADHDELGRVYFPGVDFDHFDEATKQQIIADIEADFKLAKQSTKELPESVRRAVTASVYYYEALLKKLTETPADVITRRRVRIANWRKLVLLARARVGL